MNSTPRIVLGVSGGIAAYKAAELVRLFVKDGIDVRVVMTQAATQFITPLTLQTLSGNPVLLHMFESDAGVESWAPDDAPEAGAQARAYRDDGPDVSGIEHIDIIKDAALTVVAPATADLLASSAHGIARDALTTVLLAAGRNVLFAPAMNHRMWSHPATVDNVALLRERGFHFVEPGAGYQACGETGVGRMAEPAEIFAAARALLARRTDLAGKRIVISAGRTEEPIDPVRVLSNRSSGRMGVALAEEARDRGAVVTLVAGVLSVPAPSGVTVVSAVTAAAMRDAVLDRFADADVLVMAAAVADYRPKDVEEKKIKRTPGGKSLELEPTEDIVKAAAAARRNGQVVVGFALETNDGLAAARKKLADKGLDMIVLNNPTEPGSGFGGNTNRVTLIGNGGEPEEHPVITKRAVAEVIFDRIRTLLEGTQA